MAAHMEVFGKLAAEFDCDLTETINHHYLLGKMDTIEKEEADAAAALAPDSFMGRALTVFRAIDGDSSGDLKFMELLQVFTPKQAADYRKYMDGEHGSDNDKDNVITWVEWRGFFEWAQKQPGGGLEWLEQAEDHVKAKDAGRVAKYNRAAAMAYASGTTGSAAAAAAAARNAAGDSAGDSASLPAPLHARVIAVFNYVDTNGSGVWEAAELAKMFDPIQVSFPL